MKRAGFQRIVQRDSDRMNRGPLMTHPNVATLLTDHAVAQLPQCTNQTFARAATSCGLDRDQFILYVVELHEAGMRGAILLGLLGEPDSIRETVTTEHRCIDLPDQ